MTMALSGIPARKIDYRKQAVDMIIAEMKKGNLPWRKPWQEVNIRSLNKKEPVHPLSLPLPLNPRTHKFYSGINILILWTTATNNGFTSPFWGTRKMWERMGAMVSATALGTNIVYYLPVEKKNAVEVNDRNFIPIWSEVYNLEQVIGCDHLRTPEQPTKVVEEENKDPYNFEPAEKVIAATKADIRFGGNKAQYDFKGDFIRMPQQQKFESLPGYYSTMFHELGHWTGHKKRLNRPLSPAIPGFLGPVASPEYAREELIAELTACFVMARLNLPERLSYIPSHAAYVVYWIDMFARNPAELVQAASKASRAVNFIFSGGKKTKNRKKRA